MSLCDALRNPYGHDLVEGSFTAMVLKSANLNGGIQVSKDG